MGYCNYCGRAGYHPGCKRAQEEDYQMRKQYEWEIEHGFRKRPVYSKPAFEIAGYRYLERRVSKDKSNPHYNIRFKDIMTEGDVWHKIATKQLRVVRAKTPYLVVVR